MFSHLSRRGRIRAVSFLLALLLLLCALALTQYRRSLRLEQALSNTSVHAFAEATASLDRMSTALHKGRYVTSAPMLCALCSELRAEAMTAQLALGQLPYSDAQLTQTVSFVATVGDYAQALSRRAAAEGACPEEERENWRALSQAAQSLSLRLDELELELLEGSAALDSVEQAEQRLAQDEGTELSPSGYQAIEADFPELPSLIYDGPFSQHLTGRTSAALEGRAMYTQEEARREAQRLTGYTSLLHTGSVEGTIPAYTFTTVTARGTVTMELTQQGGQLLSLLSSCQPLHSTLSPEEGVEYAAAFLTRLGLTEMEESYYQSVGNRLTVNFCYAPEGVRYYPDLVKVTVSLEDGSILGYEGTGYLTNHRVRSLPEPAVDAQKAAQAVSSQLDIRSTRLALIPTAGEYEVLCWEFLGETQEGEHVLSYINAATGAEEKLLLLIEDEHGTLAL